MTCNCDKKSSDIEPSTMSKMFPILIVLFAIALAWFFFMQEKGPPRHY